MLRSCGVNGLPRTSRIIIIVRVSAVLFFTSWKEFIFKLRGTPICNDVIMHRVYALFIIGRAVSFLPNNRGNKILIPKYLITHPPQVFHFVVVDGNKDHPVFPQQVASQVQARVHHVQPLGVEAAFVGGVGGEGAAFAVFQAGVLQVGVQAFAEVVWIDEFLAGVIGRVDVDLLDLAVVALLQQLEHFQVIALDKQVLGGVEIHRFLPAGFEGGGGRLLNQPQAVPLAGPVHAVALSAAVKNVCEFTQFRFQALQINGHLQLALVVTGFGEDAREQLFELFAALLGNVQGLAVHLGVCGGLVWVGHGTAVSFVKAKYGLSVLTALALFSGRFVRVVRQLPERAFAPVLGLQAANKVLGIFQAAVILNQIIQRQQFLEIARTMAISPGVTAFQEIPQ